MNLTEDKIDYTQVWHCPEPREGVVYRVIRDEWEEGDDKPVRHIYEWQAA